MPCVCNRQIYSDNHGISDVKAYFHVLVTVPFLVIEIDVKFGHAPATVVKGFGIVPEIPWREGEGWNRDFQ